MKKAAFFFFFVLLLAFARAQEQRFTAGLKAGISSSQVSGDDLAGFNKVGIAAALVVNGKFTSTWSAQFELLFIQKGSKYVGHPELEDFNYYRLQLNYMEVPVLLRYHFKRFTVEAGPGFGYLIQFKEEDEQGDISSYRPFNESEISYNLGVNYRIYKGIGITARFSNSISSIRDHLSGAHTFTNPGQQNTVLQLTVTYTFGNAKKE